MTKSVYFWLIAIASMLISSCSQDDIIQDDDNGKDDTKSYLSVKFMSSDDFSSRADGTGYEDGTSDENKITKVRFYFFTGSGAPANVKLNGSTYVNYYDWTPGEDDLTDETEKDHVAKKLQATIVINTHSGDKLPQQMAAVINPTETTVPSRTLQDLKKVTNDYAKTALTSAGKFVMFNSVFGNENKTAEICAVPVTSANLASTADGARANPVTIYVERNVAKVEVTMGSGITVTGGDMMELKDKDDAKLTVDGKQVYLKINGWKLAAETTTGRLGKKIDLEWAYNWWNNFSKSRSCWAINSSDAANRYYSYNLINTPLANSLYTNENAEDYTNETNESANLNHTKVILNGTLCDEDGNGLTIVRHMGAYFTDKYSATESENLPLLKKSILGQMAVNGTKFYYKDGNVMKQISEKDIKIASTTVQEKENSKNNCYVYAQLTAEAAAKAWYTSDADDATPLTGADAIINEALKNKNLVDRALVWRDGMTYYYYEIVHNLGDNTIGVVRNHVYKTKVTKIAGLGTPVYNPEDKIYPEKPDDNDHFIAAEVNILAWHIVSNSYELEW